MSRIPSPSQRQPCSAKPVSSSPTIMHPADSSGRAMHVLDYLLHPLPGRVREKAFNYMLLVRMDRPVGNLLLLWPTWWGLWLATRGIPSWDLWLIFTFGVVTMRGAGCAINDFADRKLDGHVARTAARPMPSGRVSPSEALGIFTVLLVVSFVLVTLTNRATLEMAVPGAVLAVLYPFTKRWTHLPQVVLGAAFGWSILMAFTAVTGTVPALAWLLFVANVLWSVIYDTEYAMVDRDDDLKVGSKSSAILFGAADVPILGGLMVALLLLMVWVGRKAGLGWPYWLALAVNTGAFGYQLRLICTRQRDACFRAFHQNKWWGMVVWLGIALGLAMPEPPVGW